MSAAARRSESRIYVRNRRGTPRYYADFRDYADVGGGREALIPPGSDRKIATDDPDVAARLAANRLDELEDLRKSRGLGGVDRQATIEALGERHVEAKKRAGQSDRHLANVETHLAAAVEHFGDRFLHTIRPSDVRGYLDVLRERPGRTGDTLSETTLRHYLVSLSNLYRRAQQEEVVPPGYNPVAALIDRPRAKQTEAEWMEPHEAAVLLRASRGVDLEGQDKPKDPDTGERPPKDTLPLYPILASFLLTGGRKSEVLGLAASDISFDRQTVRFRPHEWRGLKSRKSTRVVPLWPQLARILREYEGDRPPGKLLFPSPRGGGMLTDIRRVLDEATVRAARVAREHGVRFPYEAGDIRTRIFRHTYTAARLQTLDRGHPVAPYTVSRELGHSTTDTTERIYSHLGSIRNRSEAVEYLLPETVREGTRG